MPRPALFTPSIKLLLSITIAVAALVLLSQMTDGKQENVAQAGHLPAFADGLTSSCESLDGEITTLLTLIAGPLGLLAAELIGGVPEPGWVWADPAAQADNSLRFRSASGKVQTENQVARTDFPTIHDSHDFFFNVATEPGQEGVLSVANNPNGEGGSFATLEDLAAPTELHMEWEIGTFPSETASDPERTYPKWAWPTLGDRAWVDGDWIYDCGHPTTIDDTGAKLFRSEIHPMRAIAAMRQQMRTMPGSGSTPVPVTATDLYIHGHAGLAVDDLVCGSDMIIGGGSCSPVDYPRRGTPIDDDYAFDICLPPLPFDKAVPAAVVENGPDNTVTDPALEPDLDRDGDGIVFEDSTGPCAAAEFGPKMVEVKIPLDGSGVTPEDKYARRIYTGWIFPSEGLRHLKLTLNKMDLHSDKDIDPGDCECTFFFMSVDRAPDEWIRLSTFATGNMNDYDDDDLLGDGEMGFSGAEFDFYIGNGQTFTASAKGYDQDCLDQRMGEFPIATQIGGVAVPTLDGFDLGLCFTPLPDGFCLVPGLDECGDNDGFNTASKPFGPPGYGVGPQELEGGQYELEVTIEEIPLTVEDSADLVLTKDCKPDVGALAGVEFTCTILVENPQGPGLPHDVIVHDTLLTNVDPSKYTLEDPTFTFGGLGGFTDPCITPENPMEEIPGGKEFKCEIGTVPIGGKAIITMHITSQEGGDFNNYADVFSGSTDPDLSNNFDNDSVHVTAVADLSVTKSDDPDPVIAGNTLTYTLSVHNSGPSTAVNVVASDVLPSEVSVVSVSGTGGASCNAGTPGNPADPTRCAFDSMAPGANRTMTIVVKVKPDAVTNSVTDTIITFDDASVSSDTLDLDNSDNLDTEATTVQAQADLVLEKSSSGTPIAGTDILYEYRVSNNGPSVSRDVTFRDNLPAGTSFVNAFVDIEGGTGGVPLACTISQPINQVLCPLGDIALTDGVPVIIRVTVHIRANVPDGTALTNDADVLLTDTPDPDPGNSEDAVTVIVQTVADLVMTKTSDFDVIKASGRVVYILTVRNDGPSDAKNVVVTDNLPIIKQDRLFWLPGPPMCTKPAGGTLLTCTYGTIAAGTIKQIMVSIIYKGSRGIVSNTAEVMTATTFDPDLSNNSSTKTILVGSLPKP